MNYEQYEQFEIAKQCENVYHYLKLNAHRFDWDGGLIPPNIHFIADHLGNISETLKNKRGK